ncbi:hypothetical protein BO82DRAFT_139560 [Aspergillus uvarum CBS 121591]|uniref:Uncharacterized protein n=1 Tax=Aspergillus uvarum CBS 121591 TaxID=1448315 RepID=A0A319C255_9EURO|nr:hypothetical protein BO82DRAFT_139560 [Aspergillus uvarum CBS 121591]PYH79174.1 hypothetical protein BO82DRAFT_139560 [Aspergillus uvarum CBS 121591]
MTSIQPMASQTQPQAEKKEEKRGILFPRNHRFLLRLRLPTATRPSIVGGQIESKQGWTLVQVAVKLEKLTIVCSQTGLSARRTKESSALMTSTSLTSPAINHHHRPNPPQRQHIKSCLLPLTNLPSSSQNTIAHNQSNYQTINTCTLYHSQTTSSP